MLFLVIFLNQFFQAIIPMKCFSECMDKDARNSFISGMDMTVNYSPSRFSDLGGTLRKCSVEEEVGGRMGVLGHLQPPEPASPDTVQPVHSADPPLKNTGEVPKPKDLYSCLECNFKGTNR